MDRHSEKPVSTSPAGETFSLPSQRDKQKERNQLQELVSMQRGLGREIVVVMGMGSTGALKAGMIADAVDANGEPSKFVICLQRPLPETYWEIALLRQGRSPVKGRDEELSRLLDRCVNQKKTLTATFSPEVLSLADVLIVTASQGSSSDCCCEVGGNEAEVGALAECLQNIGQTVQPKCLVIMETTVPPGTTEYVASPIIRKQFEKRGLAQSEPLLAHSYERFVPGRENRKAGRSFRKIGSGINALSAQRMMQFFTDILKQEAIPVTILDRPLESETANALENSYRSTFKTFLQEWSVYSERNGVDLDKVIKAVKPWFALDSQSIPGPESKIS